MVNARSSCLHALTFRFATLPFGLPRGRTCQLSTRKRRTCLKKLQELSAGRSDSAYYVLSTRRRVVVSGLDAGHPPHIHTVPDGFGQGIRYVFVWAVQCYLHYLQQICLVHTCLCLALVSNDTTEACLSTGASFMYGDLLCTFTLRGVMASVANLVFGETRYKLPVKPQQHSPPPAD